MFFDASQAQNHGSCGVFFAPGTKKHGVYNVLWPAPSKNSGIYAVFSMLQDVLLPGQTHKNTVNYSVSAFETRWKPSRTTNKVKPKNGQIVGGFVFFEHSRSKKLRKNRVFLTPRKPKTTVFAVFFAPGTKNHGIYSVLWPEPSKNSGIYAVFSMLQDVLLPGQTHKNTVNYSVLAFETRWKPSKTTNKCPKWSISFGPKKPGKRQVGFWALPPQAPASPFKNGPISGLPPPHPLD